jgi:hypothetical protein
VRNDDHEETIELPLSELVAEANPTVSTGSSTQKGGTDPRWCSFCGKSQLEVRLLIAGLGVYVCDRCVYLCFESIEEDEDEEVIEVPLSELVAAVEGVPGEISSTKKAAPPLRCSFCGRSQRLVRRLIAGPGVYICDRCVQLCFEIIEEEGLGPPPVEPDVVTETLGHHPDQESDRPAD